MKKATLIASLLLSLACSHRKAVESNPVLGAWATTTSVVQPNLPLPPVTSEPPSVELVEAPPVLPPTAPREASGRFLQRVAYHTRTREAVKHGVSVPGLAGPVEQVSGQVSGHGVQILPSRQESRQTVGIHPTGPSKPLNRDRNAFIALASVIAAVVLAGVIDWLLTRRK